MGARCKHTVVVDDHSTAGRRLPHHGHQQSGTAGHGQSARGKLGTDKVPEVKTKQINLAEPEAPVVGGTSAGKRESAEAVSVERLLVPLAEVQMIVDLMQEPTVDGGTSAEASWLRASTNCTNGWR